ncbi:MULTISPECIES: TIGR00730 family Rossman fold protein [unclassified Bradyrhizobium]|uniref:LOG family protein n=1 Tax=unclassified Bradyrhizobium TaxID=2631580 RepID=UPI003397F92B
MFRRALRATFLAENQIGLVTGGGYVGLMGAVADAAIAAGGEVVGVIPRHLHQREIAYCGLTELHIVESMHERKTRMSELADGFIALPGGAGTPEEIFEQWTWAQLGLHPKPCALQNVGGYFDPLLLMLQGAVRQGFMRAEHATMPIVHDAIEPILDAFRAYAPPAQKWGPRTAIAEDFPSGA